MREAGTVTLSRRAAWPLRMRVSKSPTGFVIAMVYGPRYQLDFTTPGRAPCEAS